VKAMFAQEERPTAVAAGGLYVVATAAGVTAAIIGAPVQVAAMAERSGAVLLTALLIAVMAVAVAGVAIMLTPVLVHDAGSRARQGLALGYAGSRIAEGVIFLVGSAALMAMLAVGEAMAAAPDGLGAPYEAVGAALQAFSDYAWVAAQTVFCVGAVLLYALLYRSRRVPRWLSGWGLVAAPAMLLAGFTLPFTHDPNSTVSTVLYAPMALQEMVLAGWLIVRGFAPAAGAAAVAA
jgi:hypothetical protein